MIPSNISQSDVLFNLKCRKEEENVKSTDRSERKSKGNADEADDSDAEEVEENVEEVEDDTELPPELRMDEYDDSDEGEMGGMDAEMEEDDLAVSTFGSWTSVAVLLLLTSISYCR